MAQESRCDNWPIRPNSNDNDKIDDDDSMQSKPTARRAPIARLKPIRECQLEAEDFGASLDESDCKSQPNLWMSQASTCQQLSSLGCCCRLEAWKSLRDSSLEFADQQQVTTGEESQQQQQQQQQRSCSALDEQQSTCCCWLEQQLHQQSEPCRAAAYVVGASHSNQLLAESHKSTSLKDQTSLSKFHLHQQQQVSDSKHQQQQKQKTVSERSAKNHMDWNDISQLYGKMPTSERNSFTSTLRNSCFCHLLCSLLHNLFPILGAFRGYKLPNDLIGDLVAGFTIAVLHIPQGMAYGLLAGVEPIYGLYVSFVPVLVMALMSKSRHVSYGTFAIVSMLLVSSLESVKQTLAKSQQLELNHQDALVVTNNHQSLRSLIAQPEAGLEQPKLFNPQLGPDFVMPSNIEILSCVSILVGLIQVCMASARLGILSLMFSDQLVSSFTTASAVHVVSSQMGAIFDLPLVQPSEGLFKVCRSWWLLGQRLTEGFNVYTASLSLISLLFLLTVKELLEPPLKRRFKSFTCLPTELVLMAITIACSWYWQFADRFDVRIIGEVPTGLPHPQLPRLDLAPMLLEDSLTVALVSFAMNLSLAQVYAKRFRYSIEPNQELFALGTSNLVGSFFSCFPCGSSLSRTAIQSNLNAKSQLCSLFSCALVVAIVCYFAPILHHLPRSTLSCIIIVALKGILVQVRDLYENWRLSKLDALVWMATFMSVIALGIIYGLLLGIAASLFMVFLRLLTPNHSILGQLPGTDIYVDKTAFLECKEVEQVKIFRFNSALCYLNRTMFKRRVQKSLPGLYRARSFELFCPRNASNERLEEKVQFLVIDCSALAYCDYSGAAQLVDIIEELEERKLNVYLASCPLKLIVMLEKLQAKQVIERNVYPTIADAVKQAKYLRSLREDCSSYTAESASYPHSMFECLP